jgi:hypothetical protein
MDELLFVWLEITGKCQLECAHFTRTPDRKEPMEQ